jgi:predicted permease
MWTRIRAFFDSRELDRDFDQELESHLEMLAADYRRRGMTPEDARRAARVHFGGATQLREAHRAARGLPLLDAFIQDVHYALRTLRKQPGFTALAVLTLAVGIGVNTAIFTLYNAAILRPVDAADPDHLVQITRTTRDQFFSYPDYGYYRDNNRSFSGVFAMAFESVSMSGVGPAAASESGGIAAAAGFQFPHALHGSSEEVGAAVVSGNYFQALGVQASLGRTFLPEDDNAAAPPVALVSYNFWDHRFGRDPKLVGRTLMLDGVAVTVLGITPRDYCGTAPLVPNLWLPLSLLDRFPSGHSSLHERNAVCCRAYARLRPGVPARQAEAEMNTLAARLNLAFPDADANRPASQRGSFILPRLTATGPAESGANALVIMILAAVSLVLVIACANVASLLLARSAARQREIAIRLAIGAGRGRLIRQLLTETAVVSMLAGAAAILFSWWSLQFLLRQIVASVPSDLGMIALHLTPDHRVLAYMLFLSSTATAICGLAPALEASKPNLTSALKDEGAAFGGRLRKSRLRDVMVGAQVAVCLVLLIAAGLLARTSQRALQVDLGFDYRPIIFLDVAVPRGIAPAKAAATRSDLARELTSLPEIQSAAVASRLPLAGGIRSIAVSLHGESLTEQGARNSLFDLVTPSYFETMGIPIVRGRGFTPQESRENHNFEGSPVIVSEAGAHRFWPGEDPLGKRIAFGPGRQSWRFAGEEYPHSAASVVVGVAKDIRSADLLNVDQACLYFPIGPAWNGKIVLRARGDENRAVAAVERSFAANHRDLEAWVQGSRSSFSNQSAFVGARIGAIGSAIIGVLGLLMAAVGIYGAVGFAVTQRRQEIGIRMALGARRSSVLGLVLTQTMRPVFVGLAIGFLASAVASRLMHSFLFGLSALDPAAFLGASGFLAVIALLAGYLPARRATRIDPMIALRYE